MKKIYFFSLVILLAVLSGWNNGAFAQTTTFSYTGSPQTYTVAPGVTTLLIDASGAAGGIVGPCCGITGLSYNGGRVVCTLAVSGGQVLNVYVGQRGPDGLAPGVPGGWNGGGAAGSRAGVYSGGGGGGATDIRIGGNALTDRKVVAGGAGGDGYNGGNYCAGVGGGLIAQNGCNASGGGPPATGGTQTTGGTAGSWPGYAAATNGSLGLGGNNITDGGIGGGGGGGYYGGGGGVWGGGGGGSSYTDPVLCTGVAHTPGYNAGNGTVTITVLCVAPGSITGTPTMCIGGTTTLTNVGVSGGTWVSSSSAIASVGSGTGIVTGVSAGTATITYAVGNPCGGVSATYSVTVNPNPSPVGGMAPVCQGSSVTLSAIPTTGTWTASNFNASVGATTGVLTGVTAGNTNITYTLPSGCYSTAVATVNSLPAGITGTASMCAGSGTTLSDATVGGTWSSGTTSVATIGVSSGIVAGVSAGTSTVTYLLSTGCMATSVVTVNILPAAITGPASVCVGSTVTLSDATPGGVWSSSNVGQASIGIGSGIVTGIAIGTPTMSYTIPSTGCKATAVVSVNPLPLAIGGVTSVCTGLTTTLTDGTAGGTWTSSNTSVATIGPVTGLVTGVSPGSSAITYTLLTGCTTTTTVNVNSLPAVYAMTGGGTYCAGGAGVHVGLVYGSSGVDYQLYLGATLITTVPGSNAGLDFGLMTTPGTYTAVGVNSITGCSSPMSGSIFVGTNPLPALHNVTGGGGYCVGGSGVGVGLDGSNSGIKYQLYNGVTPVGPLMSGTGSAITFGIFTAAGTYTVWATNPSTGCTQLMAGSTAISINPLPTPYAVVGGGSYCAGGAGMPINLVNSDIGTTYQVVRAGSGVVSSIVSTGGYLSFGNFTAAGIYTVQAQDMLSCTNNMSGSVTITINSLPSAYTVTGGGGYCAGGAGVHIGLSFSTVGINYQLWNGATPGPVVAGSGSAIDFGLQTAVGSYYVVATNASTLCQSNMTGTVSVNINPLPTADSITGGGSYCAGGAGVPIGMNTTDFGVNYQLYRGTTPVGLPVVGTGFPVSFGSAFTTAGVYTAVGTSATGCVTNQAGSVIVSINPLPTVYTVSGGGYYCAGGNGVHVVMNGSQSGVSYQLMIGGVPGSTVLPGTGSPLDFGLQTGSGVYTVVATNTTTLCTSNMAGSATVHINPLPTLFNVTGGGSYCASGTGRHIGLDGSSSGISYQLYGTGLSGSAIAGSGLPLDFGLRTVAGTYFVVAKNLITTCSDTMTGMAFININPLPNDYSVAGGGSYCASLMTGADVYLTNSDPGIRYQLYLGSTPVGSAMDGTGTAIDYGMITTPGTYHVVATDTTTLCTKNMPGTATVISVAPAVYMTIGGGSFCAGGTGVHVGLSGSSTSESYQLYIGGVATGSPLPGTGSPIDFGLQTTADVYTITATDTMGCTANMTGSATIAVNPLPPVNGVTGGGRYCAGGVGVHVGLDGSAGLIQYQLYNGTAMVGVPVPGFGSAIDFGLMLASGTYTVKATDPATGCTSDMDGSVDVTIIPLPVIYSVTIQNDGYYCASDTSGVHIYLSGSDTGVNYTLHRGATTLATTAGSGSPLDLGRQLIAGTYTVTASDAAGCGNSMLGTVTVHIVPLPVVHNVTGGGSYCPGGAGVDIGLDASDLGIRYSLHRTGVSGEIGALFGTGMPLDFGIRDTVGTYTVTGLSEPARLTGCSNDMLGSANVSLIAIPNPRVRIVAYPGVGLGVWHIDSLHAFVDSAGPSPSYQWILNGHVLPGETNASFKDHKFFNNDVVHCIVTGSGPCGGNSADSSIVIILHDVGVNTVAANNSDVKLMPNPNKGTFTLKGDLGTGVDEELTLEVTNMMGQAVYSSKVMTQGGKIDHHVELNSSLANGMYILSLRSGTQNIVFHFVVEQ